MIKAITTRYKGFKFRSRLEAKWAVLFDHLGVKWDYEIQGYVVKVAGKQIPYLCDFWFPMFKCFAEVKPSVFSLTEFGKASMLPRPCLLLSGTPSYDHAVVPIVPCSWTSGFFEDDLAQKYPHLVRVVDGIWGPERTFDWAGMTDFDRLKEQYAQYLSNSIEGHVSILWSEYKKRPWHCGTDDMSDYVDERWKRAVDLARSETF